MVGPDRARVSAVAMLRQIRTLAADSSNVLFTDHGRRRMNQRGITTRHVMDTLLKGMIVEGPALNVRGNWQCTVRRRSAGMDTHVAVVIERGLVVVTVY